MSRRQNQFPRETVKIRQDFIIPAVSVRNLAIFFDSDASTRTHVMKTVSACFASLRQLRRVSSATFQGQQCDRSLVVALVVQRHVHGNATSAGLVTNLVDRLQAVLNAAARLVLSTRSCDRVTPLLKELHWLASHWNF